MCKIILCWQCSIRMPVCMVILSSLAATLSLDAQVNANQPNSATEPKPGTVITPARWIEQGDDWTQFLGPNGNGQSNEKGLDPTLWQPHPPIVWELPLGISYGGPAVAGKNLYQFDRYGEKELLTCYDLISAQPKWSWQSPPVFYRDPYGYNNGPRCSPIIDGNLIFLFGVNGDLTCVDITTQQTVWHKQTTQEFGVVPNFFGVASNPCVHGDKLLVMVGGSAKESRGLRTEELAMVKPDNSAIVGLDKRTGKQIYQTGNDLASYASLTVQTVAGKPTGLAFLRSGLLAFDPDDGKQIFSLPWRADFLESVNAAVPVTDGQSVLISEAYQIGSTMLSAQSTPWTIQWQDAVPRNRCRFRAHWSTPVLVDGFLYGCSGRNPDDSDFRCISWRDGQVQWTDRRRERSSVTVCDGFLIVLGEYGRLELIKPNAQRLEVIATCDLHEIQGSDGKPLLNYPCWAAPVISHGLLLLRGNDRLVCMQLIRK